jgi:hypothetical protein
VRNDALEVVWRESNVQEWTTELKMLWEGFLCCGGRVYAIRVSRRELRERLVRAWALGRLGKQHATTIDN